jgi:type IV pilus assembly protein PilM
MAIASAWGIDLGNRALKAIKLVREGDQFRIDDFEIIEHEQVLSVAGDNRESLQKTALANFVERHQTRGSAVGVSVSGQSSFARFIKLPPVEPKKIPEIVRFEAIQQIPFPLDDVEWSYQLFMEKDSPEVEVGIFAMRKELVNRHIGLFTDLGLNVQVVQMHPLAIYNGMYYDDHITQTTMFMDSGAENTDLIIADGQTVWLRTLPIGGNNFTETLAKSFRLSFAKAEELKRNAATSKYAKQIFQAMRPVFADLVAEIQRSIGFYASVHREARIQRIVALGSTFQLPGLQKYLQQNLQLPVEKLDAFKSLPPTDAKMAANLSENVVTLAGAYGLAMQALGEAKIGSSLLPERIRRAKMWQEKTKWFATAAAAMILGAISVGTVYSFNNYSYDQNQNARAEYQKTLRTARDYATKWKTQVESVGDTDRQTITNMRALADYHGMWLEFISQVLTALPNQTIAQLKATPRAQRDVISIQSIQSQYLSDMTDPLALTADFASFVSREGIGSGAAAGASFRPTFTGRLPLDPAKAAADAAAEPAPTQRGFLVTIRGSTPRPIKAANDFVSKILVSKLHAMTADQQIKNHKPYYVVKAELIGSSKRITAKSDAGGAAAIGAYARMPARGNTGSADPNADMVDADILAGQAGAGGGARFDPSQNMLGADKDGKPLFDPYEDRNFPGESIENDTVFTVLVAVILDPVPTAKTDKTEGQ